MDKKDKEALKQLGEVVCDFANAKTTDQACLKHFENMEAFIVFSSRSFTDKAKKAFPFLKTFDSLSQEEKRFLDLMPKERQLKEIIEDCLLKIGCHLIDYDCENMSLNLAEYHFEGGEWVDGEPDVGITYERPYQISLEEFKKEHGEDIGGTLPFYTFDTIDDLMRLGKEMKKVKSSISGPRIKRLYGLSGEYNPTLTLHKKITRIQKDLRHTLRSIIQGKHLDEIRVLLQILKRYNELPKSRLELIDADRLTEMPPLGLLGDSDYFKGVQPYRWHTRLRDDLTYCLIEFIKSAEMRKYVYKCDECGAFFIANRQYKSPSGLYFCRDKGDKCRLDYHNREYIKSGKAKAAKRKGRKEGKYQ